MSVHPQKQGIASHRKPTRDRLISAWPTAPTARMIAKWGGLALGFAMMSTSHGAETWWQAKLEAIESDNKHAAAAHAAVCSSNPGWKEFQPFAATLLGTAEPIAVRVKMTGARKVWIGTLGGGGVFCGEPVWVDSAGNRKPAISTPPSSYLVGRTTDSIENAILNTITNTAPGPRAFSIRADDGKPWRPRGGTTKPYPFGCLFIDSQAQFDVPEGTEWFEAEVGTTAAGELSVRFVIEIESQRALEAAVRAATTKINADISRKFPSHLDMAEQFLESRENLWAGSNKTVLTDLSELTKRYTAGCPPSLRPKSEKLRPCTPGSLAKARSLYYLGQARQRSELCSKTAELVAREGGDVPWAKAAIDALNTKIAAAFANEKPPGSALFGEAFRLRRKILFAHPALQFDQLLINKNAPTLFSHNCDQYLGRHSRIGAGPTLLTRWQSEHPKEQVLLKDRLPPGAFYKPNLSPDGKMFVFAYADHSNKDCRFFRYFLYEAAIDGSWVRQLTGTPNDPLTTMDGRQSVMVEDCDPCYLPDGGIGFVSTRSQNFGRCHGGRYAPALILYRCDKDGGGCRPLSFGIENETTPSVLNDGRILYTRWEYVDRHEMEFHKLWTTRPDGSAVSAFYGNDTIYPLMISEAQAIPGSQKIVATAMAHHSFHTGTIILVDIQKGDNGPDPITRLTPEINFPESNEPEGSGGQYATPYPLTESLFLATFSPNSIPRQSNVPPDTGYSIVLVDSLGGREPIYCDPTTTCFSPIPVVARRVAPALPSMLPDNPESDTGVYVIENVNLTRNDPEGLLKPGQIKSLRFNRLYVKPTASTAGLSSHVPVELAKRILGTVPVAADGSVVVRVPAGVPLQIQALDENGMAVMTERSFHYLHAGEYRGCVGCHADSKATPSSARASLLMRKPAELAPPADPDSSKGFSFAQTIQPVLDRYCIGCHGLDEKPQPGAFSLIGSRNGTYLASCVNLTRYTNPIGLKRETHGLEKNISRPMDYYAHGSRLGKMLLAPHQNVSLPREDFARLINWLDLNSQGCGDPSVNRIENARVDAEKEKALREAVKARFGGELSKQPYPALVNPANPDESRLLMAPLAKEAGGWGQIANGWASKDDANYKTFHNMVVATIVLPPPDIDGTCGRGLKDCVCGGCWVRYYKLNIPPLAPTSIK